MSDKDYAEKAAAWVNLLVPGHFAEAGKLISSRCSYAYKDQLLMGSAVLNAFVESHERALKELDKVEYLPGILVEFGSEGALVSVSDKISLNGKIHIYKDQLLVRMEEESSEWHVVQIKHLPISEERDRLSDFLNSAGPKRI